jgi:peptidoglycan/LPS O-acetylase OafA/YrhL
VIAIFLLFGKRGREARFQFEHPEDLSLSPVKAMASLKRIPQLDSIRGLAVLLVLLHNTDGGFYTGIIGRDGWMGVDLFFVLSGFLITGILLDSKNTEAYFRNFYARRCLRIWPLYYCTLLFMFGVIPFVRPSAAHNVFDAKSMPWWSYFVYLQNFLVSVPTRATGPLGVTWSLAIEEQFYLVWPLVVRFCSAVTLRRIMVTIICLEPVLRLTMLRHGLNVYPNTFSRLDGLMWGALVALLFRSPTFTRKTYVRPAWITLLIALPLALVTAAHVNWIVYSFSALASVSFVYVGLTSTQRWFQSILSNRFLIYSGMISYGIYLLEKLPIDLVKSFHWQAHPILVLLLGAAGTYIVATLSWYLLERPVMRLKRFFDSDRTTRAGQEHALAEAT